MYFDRIEINNYGCISEFNYSFRFDENGNPIPCVLIGENGKGKTLVIANLVDLLVESKRATYGNNLLETLENNYFKIGSKSYIKSGATCSRVKVVCKHKSKTCTLYDIMSRQPQEDKKGIPDFELSDSIEFLDSGYSKKTQGKLDKKDFTEFVSLYFPMDRYYYPMWFNDTNAQTNFETRSNIHKPNYNLIRSNMYKEIREWLIGVYLEKQYQSFVVPQAENLPPEIQKRLLNFPMDTPMQKIVFKIIRTIKGKPITSVTNFSRKNNNLGFSTEGSTCVDISQFSDGEMNLFCIFLNVIMEWDKLHSGDIKLEDIEGCVVIDEVDAGLHIDYAYRALPKLMKLFPKVQFVLTSHSPFFLAGLQKEYGEDVDIISMPDGIKLTDISAFGEIKKAQDLFNENIQELRDKYFEQQKLISELQNKTDKVLVYTEGETDVILVKKAIEKLGVTDIEVELFTASNKQKSHSDSVLKNFLENLQSNNSSHNNTIIGMFDRDAKPPIKIKCVDGTDRIVNDEAFLKLGERLYVFSIPVPHERPETDQISIEHYFTDEEIKTPTDSGQRLFLGNEFHKSGNHKSENFNYTYLGALFDTIKIIEHQSNNYVTDYEGNGDYSLSKMRFAENVRDDVDGFNNFDFSEFNKIFDIIRQIIADTKEK